MVEKPKLVTSISGPRNTSRPPTLPTDKAGQIAIYSPAKQNRIPARRILIRPQPDGSCRGRFIPCTYRCFLCSSGNSISGEIIRAGLQLLVERRLVAASPHSDIRAWGNAPLLKDHRWPSLAERVGSARAMDRDAEIAFAIIRTKTPMTNATSHTANASETPTLFCRNHQGV